MIAIMCFLCASCLFLFGVVCFVQCRFRVLNDTLLLQVLYELVSNGFKFSTGSVELTATVSDGFALISVQDSGCGIPPDQIAQIWGPFHQVFGEAQRGACRSGDGLGLGLYLVGTKLLLCQLESQKVQAELALVMVLCCP